MNYLSNTKSAAELIYRAVTAFKMRGDTFNIITTILVIYNCRIGEILNATWTGFVKDKFLILPAEKNSQNVIVRDREILKSISQLPRISKNLIFPFVSYHSIYHHIKKNYSHLLGDIKFRKNKKITHAFRYLNIDGIKEDQVIKTILHHNSIRSGSYYKNKIKEK